FTAASNSPSNEQQTQPPPSSAIRTFFPSITFVSIAISPNSFITIAIFAGRVARMYRSSVVLPLPSGPVTRVMGVRGCIGERQLSFHIPDRRESRDWLADAGQFGRFDHFVNVFVSSAGFLRETCPGGAADVNAARFQVALELFAVPLFARFGPAHCAAAAVRGAKKCLRTR